MMDSYSAFAKVYDVFMDNVPYDEWCEYVHTLLQAEDISKGLLLELGCGTGSVTRRMAAMGYDMIGIDLSPDMLMVAKERDCSDNADINQILYLQQNMTEFELYGTVTGVICICDGLNYILEDYELLQVFSLVNNYLDPGGIFVFDLNTKYKYEHILGDNVFAENREEGSFIWENEFDPESGINEYDLTLFLKDDNKNHYFKYEETHIQKAYDLDKIKVLLEEAGLQCLHVYDAFTQNEPGLDSERVYFVARESRKNTELVFNNFRMDDK